jgi:hypothetical protein
MLIPLLLLFASAATAPITPHLRGVSARETALIQDLLARSATARALAAEIEARDVIVYVEMIRTQARGRGLTRFVAASQRVRYLRITLGAVPHRDDLAALLAHELQHATEIARAPDVVDDAGVLRLYRIIGEERGAGNAFETAAAREVGARVRTELSQGRVASFPPLAPLLRF